MFKDWKVLFVKPRTEKKVAEFCKLYEIPCYLPLREQSHRVPGRQKKVSFWVPVFPGYVFVELHQNRRLDLLKTNLLVRILEPLEPKRMLRDLIMVRRALRANPALKAAEAITKGKWVRITAGPFMGIEGRVSRLNAKSRVTIGIEMIGQAVAVEIPMDDLELVKDHPSIGKGDES